MAKISCLLRRILLLVTTAFSSTVTAPAAAAADTGHRTIAMRNVYRQVALDRAQRP